VSRAALGPLVTGAGALKLEAAAASCLELPRSEIMPIIRSISSRLAAAAVCFAACFAASILGSATIVSPAFIELD
jgi:hypothetical protein